MVPLAHLRLLEETHEFPGPYIFKAIGRNENGFAARVVAAIRDELGEESDPPFKLRETAGGRHVAVTVTPVVQKGHQVIAVYRRVQKLAGLVMLF